jgi:hypothetical protein
VWYVKVTLTAVLETFHPVKEINLFHLHYIVYSLSGIIPPFPRTTMAPCNSGNNSKTKVTSTSSPIQKKGRKQIQGQKSTYSPWTKVPNTNKVYVVGTLLGLILIHTERQNSKDDAFTNNAIKMIEDEETGVAAKLNIIKICSR